MDSPKTPITDPSILLLNEIEILLAQSRLLELYLKQSQATSAYEKSQVQARYQYELAELRTALAEKERIVAAQETAVSAKERDLQERVQSLETHLSESQRRLQQRDTEYQRAESEAADLRKVIDQLEVAKTQAQTSARESATARQDFAAEVASLREQLEENQLNFYKQNLASRELQNELHVRIAQLHAELNEKATWSHNTGAELQQAKREITELHGRIADLQTNHQSAQADTARQLAESRARFDAQLHDLQTVLAERDRAVVDNQNATVELERELRTEILTLRSQLEQKQELIGFRDDELRDHQSRTAALQQRIAELEAAQETARVDADQIENARRSYENQIAALQHEVTVRERALTERQEAVSAAELALHGKIQSLQQELFHSHSLIEERDNTLRISRGETETLREQIRQHESATAADLLARQRAEEACRELESEVSRLHSTLAQKEYALDEREKALASVEQRLRGEIDELHRQVDQQRVLVDTSETELGRLRSEIAAIEEEKTRLASSHDELEGVRRQEAAARGDLEARLLAKDDELRAALANAQESTQAALRAQENHFKSIAEQTNGEIVGLRNQLQEQELATQQRGAELTQLRTESAGLREQIARTEQARDGLERELRQMAAQRDELGARLQVKVDEFQAAQANATEHLAVLEEHKARLDSLEEERRVEVSDLRGQLDQHRMHAESLHEELTRLRSEHAGMREDRAQSERRQQELEQNRREISALREELEKRLLAKDAELQAAESAATALKNGFDARINELQLQLAQKQLVVESRALEIQNFKDEVDRLSEQLTRRDSVNAEFQAQFQREAELARTEHQATIAALRDEYQIKQRDQESELNRERQQVAALTLQIGESRQQKTAIETQIQERQRENESVAVEAAALRARLDELETQRRMELSVAEREQDQLRGRLEAELAAVRAELEHGASASAQHLAALAQLRDEYQIKQRDQESELAREKQRVVEFTLQIGEFEQQKAAIETQLQERQREHETVAVEAAALRARLDELETRRQMELSSAEREQNQVRSQLEVELAAARSEVQQKAWAAAQHQATLENLALAHKEQIQKLEGKIAEQQNSIKDRQVELERSQTQASLLEQRIEKLNDELRQAELTAVSRAVDIKEEYGVRIADLERQVAQKTVELQERGASTTDVEQTLRTDVERLIRESQERHQILHDRNEELVRVKAEMDALQDQFRTLESTASQNEACLNAEAEKMRTEFQAQLALLQAELSQKEWALEEQRAATGTIEAQFRQNLETLNQQLAETEARANEDQEFVMGENERTSEQQERYRKFRDTLDAVVVGNDGSFPASENRRRWRGGFGWKRRWKT